MSSPLDNTSEKPTDTSKNVEASPVASKSLKSFEAQSRADKEARHRRQMAMMSRIKAEFDKRKAERSATAIDGWILLEPESEAGETVEMLSIDDVDDDDDACEEISDYEFVQVDDCA